MSLNACCWTKECMILRHLPVASLEDFLPSTNCLGYVLKHTVYTYLYMCAHSYKKDSKFHGRVGLSIIGRNWAKAIGQKPNLIFAFFFLLTKFCCSALQSCSPAHVDQPLGFKWHRFFSSIPLYVPFINVLVSLQNTACPYGNFYVLHCVCLYLSPTALPFSSSSHHHTGLFVSPTLHVSAVFVHTHITKYILYMWNNFFLPVSVTRFPSLFRLLPPHAMVCILLSFLSCILKSRFYIQEKIWYLPFRQIKPVSLNTMSCAYTWK